MNEETFKCLTLQTDGMLCLLASTSRPASTTRPSPISENTLGAITRSDVI